MGSQYLCLSIPEIGSLQKERMKSLTVPLQGFSSTPHHYGTECIAEKKCCNRMVTRREKDHFSLMPKFRNVHILLYSSSVLQRPYARVIY